MSMLHEGEKVLGPPKWDSDSATVDTWLERVKFFVLSVKQEDRVLLGPQLIRVMDPNSRQYLVATKMKDTDVVAEDGALRVAKFIKESLAETTLQDAATAFKDLLKGHELRRQAGEGMKSWSQRLTQVFTKTGRKLHAA